MDQARLSACAYESIEALNQQYLKDPSPDGAYSCARRRKSCCGLTAFSVAGVAGASRRTRIVALVKAILRGTVQYIPHHRLEDKGDSVSCSRLSEQRSGGVPPDGTLLRAV